jgi:hypothetical protein
MEKMKKKEKEFGKEGRTEKQASEPVSLKLTARCCGALSSA